MSGALLGNITGPADVKALSADQLPQLCAEIRRTLLDYGKAHGGHIGSNLGMVEATVALHRVFDSPRDRIVFDVSHQSYVHKMLTGRAAAYLDAERYDEVTGFTNPLESEHDHFVLGHTGTSISLACGLAKTRDMSAQTASAEAEEAEVPPIGNVIAVIGDGSLSSGIAFEGLNNAAEQGGNLIVIVNDNEMSIAGDFGGMYGPLARLRASGGTAQPNIFQAFGLDYRYVEDGNDVAALVDAFEGVKNIDHPIVLHIHTLKGLGLAPAGDTAARRPSTPPHEDAPWHSDLCDLSDRDLHAGQCEASHWQSPDAAADRPDDPRKHYGKLAMAALEARFEREPGLVVISPATPGSNGITHAFRERAGRHYVDTGITESHAVAFASGIAKAGGVPVLATTASFFQRAYDQLQQELALNGTRVTLLDFLGGLSGSDNTHSGAFDIAMFANIPGLTCLAPTGEREFLDMLAWSTGPASTGPVVIRVPGEPILAAERAGSYPLFTAEPDASAADDYTGYRITHAGGDVAVLGLGNTYPLAERVAATLRERHGIDATVVNPRQCSTLDTRTLEGLRGSHRLVVTLEDGQLEGGWGEKITAYYANADSRTSTRAGDAAMRALNFGAAKEFTDRVPLAELDARYGLTEDGIVAAVLDAL
ncbi:1-deoxy-D-xylulose-5-phosphate synthase [Bifidobacterium lemurum]|uniref:1-deoxy-D-xylulose-5-phosphate synthase n=1 Tax=Bifidobacterium lemurum TaxID=1603886 RepID=A0A261FSU0_9BIFI|nr:1-deoxy-D-xylulose-5-phosphate synthase [Bifidobacterium lemurum]OZG62219.1 1-deoxy-D-xylulose-5-phosphate synthase [Bifidobacterium lemurum]QOL33590.1 1-deoxy-D-xylulose-5-phosphate synthase [Bifidobacterium lemurum]